MKQNGTEAGGSSSFKVVSARDGRHKKKLMADARRSLRYIRRGVWQMRNAAKWCQDNRACVALLEHFSVLRSVVRLCVSKQCHSLPDPLECCHDRSLELRSPTETRNQEVGLGKSLNPTSSRRQETWTRCSETRRLIRPWPRNGRQKSQRCRRLPWRPQAQSARGMSTGSSGLSRRQSPTSSLLSSTGFDPCESGRLRRSLFGIGLVSTLGPAPRASTVLNVFADTPRPDLGFLHASRSRLLGPAFATGAVGGRPLSPRPVVVIQTGLRVGLCTCTNRHRTRGTTCRRQEGLLVGPRQALGPRKVPEPFSWLLPFFRGPSVAPIPSQFQEREFGPRTPRQKAPTPARLLDPAVLAGAPLLEIPLHDRAKTTRRDNSRPRTSGHKIEPRRWLRFLGSPHGPAYDPSLFARTPTPPAPGRYLFCPTRTPPTPRCSHYPPATSASDGWDRFATWAEASSFSESRRPRHTSSGGSTPPPSWTAGRATSSIAGRPYHSHQKGHHASTRYPLPHCFQDIL